MKKNKQLNYFYYHIYKSLIPRADPAGELDVVDVESYLGLVYHVPLTLRIVVLKEMEQAGLLTFISRFRLKIIKECVTELDNKSKIYKEFGLW